MQRCGGGAMGERTQELRIRAGMIMMAEMDHSGHVAIANHELRVTIDRARHESDRYQAARDYADQREND